MAIKILTPKDCDPKSLKVFYDLVVEGGQVMVAGLEDRIKNSDFLAFYEQDNQIAGVGSIKNPDADYKQRIFKKAGVENLANNYESEIGYAVTKLKYRGKGISQKIISHLIDQSNSKSFFATTKVDDMRHILTKMKFKKLGNSYKNNKNETLDLYHFNKT